MITKTTLKSRLSRDEWLERSLALLAQNKGNFRLDELVNKLGVTKGSFYWHFKSRNDFVHSLLDYWESTSTNKVLIQMEQYRDNNAEQRLLALMRILRNKEFSNHDLAIRNMASWNQGVAAKVVKVDELRLGFVRSLFSELGFINEDLEVRTHLFAVFHSMNKGFLGKELTGAEIELKAMHAFFIQK